VPGAGRAVQLHGLRAVRVAQAIAAWGAFRAAPGAGQAREGAPDPAAVPAPRRRRC